MRRSFIAIGAIGLAAALCLPAYAADTEKIADWEVPAHWTHSQRERYRGLLEELRCLVCQNENLASSSASLAGDLRGQVREMIDRGESDKEIKEYLVSRYGDFVLYDPPVKPSTWLLWGGPFVVLLLGLIFAWRVIRSASRTGASELSEEEHARARRYLDTAGDTAGNNTAEDEHRE